MHRHLFLSCSMAASFLLFGAMVGGQDAPPAPRDDAPGRVEPRRESEEPHNEVRPRRDTTDLERDIVREMFRQRQEELKRKQEKLRHEFRERTERLQEAEEKDRINHIQQAIAHLHAAGLHTLADRLTREMQQRQQRPQNRFPGHSAQGDGFQTQPDRGPSQGPGGHDPLRQDLQRQLDDLRRQFEEMRRRMDAPPNRGYRRTEMSDVR